MSEVDNDGVAVALVAGMPSFTQPASLAQHPFLGRLAAGVALVLAFASAEVACGARTSLFVEPGDAAPIPLREGGSLGRCYTALPVGEQEQVDFQFVVDGSGSMNSDRKWEASERALGQVFDDFLGEQAINAAVGLIVFSDLKDPTRGSGPYPTKADVLLGPFDRTQHKELRDRFDTTYPLGATPMYEALTGAFGAVETFARAQTSAKKVVILLTDGVPVGPPAEIITLAGQYEKKAIRLFVVGIGRPDADSYDYDPSFLSKLAIAGGTRRSSSCGAGNDYCHYQIDSTAVNTSFDLVAALSDARLRSSGACEYAIVGEGTLLQDATEVSFDDGAGGFSTIEQDEIDGWTFDNPGKPSRLIVRGKACAMIQANKQGGLSIRLSCEKK